MISALRNLAERIDTEWRTSGYKAGDLPAIAARLLSETRPDREYDLAALADWTLLQAEFPEACNPFGPLGPPAFTVWSNPHFYVNVYAYTTPEVVIHDHDFAGAFMNLSGVTIHCTYDFSGADPIDSTVHVGGLRLRGIEAISDGSVRQIEPGQSFIHQVWHVSQPTVVLVVRTPSLKTAPQFQYIRPSIATQVFRTDSLSVGIPERFRYTRKMAECLRTSSTGVDYVKQLVEHERPWDAIWHLIENWRYLRAEGALEDVIALGAKNQGEWFAGISAAGSEVDLFYSIDWPRVVTARDRIVLALLLSLGSWRSIRKAIESVLPGSNPAELIVESLGRLGNEHTIPLDLKPQARAVLTSMLQGDGTAEQELERAMRQHVLLRPLFSA
ncbi:MAG TPA: hypothetical protein VF219_09210 [Vicinamibacterales bacterium]